ncbi:MAG: TetR/AcrR family transcriptional regulator [Acidimicrobiales bacterium]|jgi:AcrR family transcriptional regulator
MAKPGTTSHVGARSGTESAETRAALVEATIATLRTEGYAGTSARAIARTAGLNQALVFYHFGSVTNLLLAALDATSLRRMEQYKAAVAAARGIDGLAEVAAGIFHDDLDGGHMSVLAELIAGASSVPGLGAEVGARIAPWIEFTEHTLADTLGESPLGRLLPAGEIAYAIVALYLGIEMLAHLDGDRSRAEALFATAQRLAGLMSALLPERGADRIDAASTEGSH